MENSLAGLDSVKPMRATSLCVLGILLTACAELFGPTWGTRIGSIISGTIVAPDSAAVGADFTVSLKTSGGGCNKAGYTTSTLVDSLTAEIRPYDYYQINPSACTLILATFLHATTVQFPKAGIATLHVIGAYNDSTITTTRTVVVR